MPENPMETLVQQVNMAVAAVGYYLSQAPDIESVIPVLQDLSSLRAQAQSVLEKHREFFEQVTQGSPVWQSAFIPAPENVSAQNEPLEKTTPEKTESEAPEKAEIPSQKAETSSQKAEAPERPEARRPSPPRHVVERDSSKGAKPVRPASKKTVGRSAAAEKPRGRGRPRSEENADYTPLPGYRPFILRALQKLEPGTRYADVQKTALQIMKDEGVARPQDEEPVGASGVIRYIAQCGALKKQLLREHLIEGSGSEGFHLTEEGNEELRKLAS